MYDQLKVLFWGMALPLMGFKKLYSFFESKTERMQKLTTHR